MFIAPTYHGNVKKTPYRWSPSIEQDRLAACPSMLHGNQAMAAVVPM
jgi:hypothetical protein